MHKSWLERRLYNCTSKRSVQTHTRVVEHIHEYRSQSTTRGGSCASFSLQPSCSVAPYLPCARDASAVTRAQSLTVVTKLELLCKLLHIKRFRVLALNHARRTNGIRSKRQVGRSPAPAPARLCRFEFESRVSECESERRSVRTLRRRLVAPVADTPPSEKASVLRFSYARSLCRVSIENGWELEGAEHMVALVARARSATV